VARRVALACALLAAVPMVAIAAARWQHQHAENDDLEGWTVPANAAEEKNPIAVTPQTLAAGRALFQKNCRRCHGPKGVGDGPDADPDHMADMDLTNPKRAANNPDGVIFHKVWNGRQDPKMPAFKEELSREQVWTIVAYVQTLRKGSSQ
jgi:mono/diheme cytochrome c family protein